MVCWATRVSSAPGVEAPAVKVATIPGIEVRNGGIVAAGAVSVSLGEDVSVGVGWGVSVEVGTTVATSCGSTVAEST
jgi:hypothetical protein